MLDDEVRAEWATLVEQNQFPDGIPNDPLGRDLAQAEMLRRLAHEIQSISQKLYNPEKGEDPRKEEREAAETWAGRATTKLVKNVSRIAENYYSSVISEEQYTALTDTSEGKAPIRQLSEHLSAIVKNLETARNRFEHVTQGRKSKVRKSAADIKDLLDSVPGGKETSADVLEKGIKDAHHAYLERRDRYHAAIEQAETNADFSELGEEATIDRLAIWDASADVLQLESELEKEEGLLAEERDAYQRRLANVKRDLGHTLPGMRSWLTNKLEGMIQEEEGRTGEFIVVGDEGVIVNDQRARQVVAWTEGVAENLGSKGYFTLVGEQEDKEMEPLKKRMRSLAEQLDYYRRPLGSFIALAEESISDEPLLTDTERFNRLSREYNLSFGQPSWQNKRERQAGIYQSLALIEERFLAKVSRELSEAAGRLSILDPDDYERAAPETEQWHDFIERIEQGKSRKNTEKRRTIYHVITDMEEFHDLQGSLETPHLLVESLKRLHDIGHRVPLYTEYDELSSWYQSTMADLLGIVRDLPEEMQEHPTVAQLLQRQRERIATKLSDKLLGVPEPESLHEHSAHALRNERRMLEELLEQSADAAPEALAHIEEVIDHYAVEESRRQKLPYRIGGLLRRMIWGPLPERMLVPDTNEIVNDPDMFAKLGERNGIVILDSVLQELDKMSGDRNADKRFRAREAKRGIARWTEGASKKEDEPQDERRRFAPGTYLGEIFSAFSRRSKKSKEEALATPVRKGLSEYLGVPEGISRIFSFNKDASLMRLASRPGLTGIFFTKLFTSQMHDEYESWRDKVHILGAMKLRNTLRDWLRPWSQPQVVFLSSDSNAAHAAAATTIQVERYRRGSIMRDPKELYPGYRQVELPDSLWRDLEREGMTGRNLEAMMELAINPAHARVPHQKLPTTLQPNEFVVAVHPDESDRPLWEAQRAIVARHLQGLLSPPGYVPTNGELYPLFHFAAHPEERLISTCNPKDILQVAAAELLLDPQILCCSMVGGPGTGKTLLATGAGYSFVREQRSPYNVLQYTRPNVSTGKDPGAYPGGAISKQIPMSKGFLGHLADAWAYMEGDEPPEKMLGRHGHYTIDLVALADIRGMDISHTFRIMDEGQNTTLHEMRTWLSRHATSSKSVMMGDLKQSDMESHLRYSNGLLRFRTAFIGNPWYGHITFQRSSHRSLVAEAADRV